MVAAAAAVSGLGDEQDVPPEKLAVMNVGKIDAKRRLGAEMTEVMSSNITQCMAAMLDTIVFKQDAGDEAGGDGDADDMDL
eukprot:SAG22_NODE_1199_length_5185_cov_5.251278_2_plen_81_part_00